jgi:hypothetical protein
MLNEIIQYGQYDGLERGSFAHFQAWMGKSSTAQIVLLAALFSAIVGLLFLAFRSNG